MVKCSASIENTHNRRHTRTYSDMLCIWFCGHTWRTWLGSKPGSWCHNIANEVVLLNLKLNYSFQAALWFSSRLPVNHSELQNILTRGNHSSQRSTGQSKDVWSCHTSIAKSSNKARQTSSNISNHITKGVWCGREGGWKHFWNRNEAWTKAGMFFGSRWSASKQEHDNENIHLSNVVA